MTSSYSMSTATVTLKGDDWEREVDSRTLEVSPVFRQMLDPSRAKNVSMKESASRVVELKGEKEEAVDAFVELCEALRYVKATLAGRERRRSKYRKLEQGKVADSDETELSSESFKKREALDDALMQNLRSMFDAKGELGDLILAALPLIHKYEPGVDGSLFRA